MIIAFVLERLGNGGAERVTAALARAMAENDRHEVHVLTYVKEENEYTLPRNVTRHILGDGSALSGVSGILTKIRYLMREIKRIKPDYVISLATPKTSILLTGVSVRRKYKLILSERNDPAQYPGDALLKLLRDQAYRMADGIVFQTPDAKRYFDNRIRTKCDVIPNPVSDSLPERYQGERRKAIVNFCRIEPQKNIRLLIDAFLGLPDIYKDYTLEIYGTGVQLDELQQYVADNNADKRIVFKGFDSNIHEKINDAALFVSSSDYEGISNSMIEALAMGIPTICTDCPIGGARLMIDNGENGILTPVGDTAALTAAICDVLSNPEKARTMGIRGTEIRKQYSASNVSERWLRFMEEV